MKITNVFMSFWILALVIGATLATAANPIKLLSQPDSNLNFIVGLQDCPERPDSSYVTLVMDLQNNSNSEIDALTMEMMNEANSRHIKVEYVVTDLSQKTFELQKYLSSHRCNFKRISQTTEEQRQAMATTYDYGYQTVADTVEVVQTCQINFMNKGECVLVTRPQDYVDGAFVNRTSYQAFLKIIMSLGVLAAK